MAFTLHSGTPQLIQVLIKNSITINVGELVKAYVDGYATNGTAAVGNLGIVHGFCYKDGTPVNSVSSPTAGTAASPSVTQVVAASDNQTTQLYWALVDISRETTYSAQVNGTLGTTASSTLLGCRIDVDSAGTNYGRVLETTATRTNATDANFYSLGLDPQDSTRLIVSCAFSERYMTSP